MTLLDFIHDLRLRDLPAPVVAQARRCLLDLAGVAASGRRTPVAEIALRHASRHFGAGEGGGVGMLFDRRRASPVGAAFAGATLIDSFDAHDGHALTKGHAGVALLPALLALCEAERPETGGEEILTALVLGYEIATRAGIALHASACDYHTSGAWNAIACAALGARVLGLDRQATREALGTAEYNGPRSQMMRCIDHPTMVKDGSGIGAMIGVSAAYLAADGYSGAPAITLEDPSLSHLWDDLGSSWRIQEQYFKLYPVCRWAQPCVEAVRSLMAEHALRAGDIASVELRTFAQSVRLAAVAPRTTEEAQYSLPFPVAAMILRGRLTADEITGEGLRDPEVLALSARLRLVEDPEISARFPAERFGVAAIETRDGRRLVSPWTEARGGPHNPLSDAEILGKFTAQTEALGGERQEAIRRTVEALPGAGLRDLLPLLLQPLPEAAPAPLAATA